MRLAPGDTFDRYVIESLLGEGGTGEVYGAVDTRLRRKIALKVLRDVAEGDPEAWNRQVALILREARAAAALNHPGIVAIYDVGEHQCIPYIAMEVARGKLLRELIGAEVPLAERLRILLEVARALAAAHRAGLVHRDVKPENVVVREDGSVKVLDFGIARPARVSVLPEAAEGRISINSEEELFEGTPAYMSPERVRGEEVDARADQFAWGVISFELLAGKLPFRDERGPATLLASIMSDPPPPLEGVPEEVDALVRRALAKEPDERFATMDDVVAELSLLVPEEAPVVEELRESAVPTSRWPRRGPALVVAALLVVVVGVASLLSLGRWRPALRAEPRTAERLFVPMPITSLPDPHSNNREAIAAYRQGLAALRRAYWEAARVDFERAASLDPSLGGAHLRVAITSFWQGRDSAREALRKAILYRQSLSEREQDLLEMHEPLIQREPPDYVQALLRLHVAHARFPGDVELLTLYQFFTDHLTPEFILEQQDRCVELDRQHADCWQGKARMLVRLGRLPEAREAVNVCIAVAPDTSDCLFERLAIDKIDGNCASLERHARSWIEAQPEVAAAHAELAIALHGQGRSGGEVQDTVDRAVARWEQSGARIQGEMMRAQVAISRGDFATAERILRVLQDGNKYAQGEDLHMTLAVLLVEVLQETGRTKEAAEEASSFLARRSVLLTPLRASAWTDRTMLLWRAVLEGGRISHGEYEDARREFLARWSSPIPEKRAAAWFMGHALPALTRKEAEEALAGAPDLGSHDDHWQVASLKNFVAWIHGRTRLFAGDAAAARSDLALGTADCNALGDPMRHTQAHYHLGAAREALGERAGACAAYGVVIEHWGKNTASRTARDAVERAAALGCGADDPRADQPAIRRLDR